MEHEGDRYEERPEEQESSEQDWYFDLPSHAWERQKQVHQRLREQLLAKEREKEPERDPFTGLPIERKGLFGRFRRKKPRLPEELERELRARQRETKRADEAPQEIEYSTEPGDWRLRTDARPLLRREPAPPPPPPDDEEEPRSKWEEFFGGGLPEENPLEAMRRWAKGEPLSQEAESPPAAAEHPETAELEAPRDRAEDETPSTSLGFPSFAPWEDARADEAEADEGPTSLADTEPVAAAEAQEDRASFEEEPAAAIGAPEAQDEERGSGLDFPSFAPWPEPTDGPRAAETEEAEETPAARWRSAFATPHEEESSWLARERPSEEPESDEEGDTIAAMRRWARGDAASPVDELGGEEAEPMGAPEAAEASEPDGERSGFFTRFWRRREREEEPSPPDTTQDAAASEAETAPWLPAEAEAGEPHAAEELPVAASESMPSDDEDERAAAWTEEAATAALSPAPAPEATGHGAEPEPPPDEDDPWAEWLAASGSGDEEAPAADVSSSSSDEDWRTSAPAWSVEDQSDRAARESEPAAARAAEEEPGGDDPWSAFTPSTQAERETSAQEEADPWGALAEATGYDERAAAPPPPMRSSEVHRRSGDWLADQFPPADGVFGVEPATDHAPSDASEEPATQTEQEAERASAQAPEREWQPWTPDAEEETEPDEDVILKAFEEHAATAVEEEEEPDLLAPELTGGGRRRLSLRDLLGEDAEDIVAELEDEADEPTSFADVHGWAPQWPGAVRVFDDDDPVDESAAGEPAAAPAAARASGARSTIRFIVQLAVSAALVILLIRASTQTFRVDGTSMWPTLSEQDWVVVNTLAYETVDLERLSTFLPFIDPGEDGKAYVFGPPQRGDIIVFQDPTDPSTDLIKRIIALPGEKVEIIDGHVYINDRLLEEPYIQGEWHGNRPAAIVPEGHYFVLGDNRDNSKDSRSPQIGYVPEDLIIGKAMFIVWPKGHFGFAPNESGRLTDVPAPSLSTMRGDHE